MSGARQFPTVAVLLGAAWPDNDASGPVQSMRTIAALLADQVRFELFARNGPPGGAPQIADGTRTATPWGAVTYCAIGPGGARRLARRVDAVAPDRLWLNSVWDREFTLPALVARRCGRLRGRPALLSTRGEFAPGALAINPARKRIVGALLPRLGLLDGVLFHATDAAEAAYVRRAFPARPVFVAANLRRLAPLPDSSPQGGDRRLELLFLGRISPVKGLDNALEALARVRRPVRLTIHGPVHDASYWARCRALIARLPAHVEASWAGPIDNAAAAAAYARADLFLNPSSSENFGHTIYESLESGTPVLTGLHTPWNGLLADGAGINVASEDAAAIAAAIDRFVPSNAGRVAARRRAEDFVAGQKDLPRWRAWLRDGVVRA